MKKVIVIGGGPSGIMAAYSSSMLGNDVTILEKNEKLGKKLYITGKGRCNVTNNCTPSEFIKNVVSNPKFLYSAINTFSPQDSIDLLTDNGLELKTERGNRVFPVSDKSSDVIKTLHNLLVNSGVDIKFNTEVKDVFYNDGKFTVITKDFNYTCDKLIVCTGGISYPLTGSTGDGYVFAKKFGHSINKCVPSLVGLESSDIFCKECQGLSLKNVVLTAKILDKIVFSELGEMMFTHFGISGPLVLSLSSLINRINFENLKVYIDFKPALSFEQLDNRLLRELNTYNKCSVLTAFYTLLPKSLAGFVIKNAGVPLNKTCSNITVNERKNLIDSLKNFEVKISGLRNIEESIVTAGGINVLEVNPKTMESKLIKGLYFAGEVLDVDCFTGGFNIQSALSTGFLAGKD